MSGVGWCWFALLPGSGAAAGGALASAPAFDREDRPVGLLAAWRSGRKPVRHAVRMDERLLDPTGPPAWVSVVLVPVDLQPLFDDPAVSGAMRAVLRRQTGAAVSTLVRDSSHFAGAVTVSHRGGPESLRDDPFARLHPPLLVRTDGGLFGAVPVPSGPAIQRYAGKPWPAYGF